jgi:hypothetical protein
LVKQEAEYKFAICFLQIELLIDHFGGVLTDLQGFKGVVPNAGLGT